MNRNNSNALVFEIVNAIQEAKGVNIKILDLKSLNNVVSDYFIVCEGTSNIHIKYIANTVEKLVSKSMQEKPFSSEGITNAEWVLIDYVKTVVHIFQQKTRELFDIEGLWGDAKITNVKPLS